MQMTLTTDDIRHDLAHYEELATLSGRPILYNVVQAFETGRTSTARPSSGWSAAAERGIPVYGQGVTTDAGFTFTFEDWNLFDDSEAWMEATTGTLEERLRKLADPARRQGLKDQPPYVATAPIDTVTVLAPRSRPRPSPSARCRSARSASSPGKHPVDAMLDIAVADGLQTDVLRRPAAGLVGPPAARSCSTRTCCSACPTAAPTRSSSPPAATRPRRSPSTCATTSGSPTRRPTGGCPRCPPSWPGSATAACCASTARPTSSSTTTTA